MKTFLTFFLSILLYCSYGQIPKDDLCKAMQMAVEHQEFDKTFLFSKHLDTEFRIVDKDNILKQCKTEQYKSRKIEIIQKTKEIDINTVILSYGERSDNNFSLGFWCQYNGSAANFHFRVTDNKVVLIGYNIGDY